MSPEPALAAEHCKVRQGTLTEGEGLSTVALLALTSLDEFIFILKIYVAFFYKTSYLNEEVNCTEPSPSVSIPWFNINNLNYFSQIK